MLRYILISITTLLSGFCNSQQTFYGSITHEGLEREYILYIPSSYTGDSPVPLVFNFHGFGSNAEEQMFYGDFRSIADTAGFLIVHPQGTLFNGSSHWNVGGWTIGSTVDDVGFTGALIDSLQATYNIHNDRIYSTGMSNGGFMSFLLAGQLSERIAAIASVTGSMTPETYNSSDPQHPMPVLQIHGTSDNVVPYNGASYSKPIGDVLDYWVGFNNCDPYPEITALPDLNPNDGSTVEWYIYENGDNGVPVEHFKILGGGHTWPGSIIQLPGTNYDINASAEIWNFFYGYDINGAIVPAGTEALYPIAGVVRIYPNPTNSTIIVENNLHDPCHYDLYSLYGECRLSGIIVSQKFKIDLSGLASAVYILKIGNKRFTVVKID